MEKLAEASAAEAEAASAVWQAVQAASATSAEETSVSDSNSQVAETTSEGSDIEADVRLHPRAVCTMLLCCYVLKRFHYYVIMSGQATHAHIPVSEVIIALYKTIPLTPLHMGVLTLTRTLEINKGSII